MTAQTVPMLATIPPCLEDRQRRPQPTGPGRQRGSQSWTADTAAAAAAAAARHTAQQRKGARACTCMYMCVCARACVCVCACVRALVTGRVFTPVAQDRQPSLWADLQRELGFESPICKRLRAHATKKHTQTSETTHKGVCGCSRAGHQTLVIPHTDTHTHTHTDKEKSCAHLGFACIFAADDEERRAAMPSVSAFAEESLLRFVTVGEDCCCCCCCCFACFCCCFISATYFSVDSFAKRPRVTASWSKSKTKPKCEVVR